MKVRTCVLIACMTIVPALALFSHQLPAGVREAFRSHVWEPAEAWVASIAKREPATIVSEATEAPADQNPAAQDTVTTSEASPEYVAEVHAQQPEVVRAQAPSAAEPSSAAAESLVSLGAMAIDCRPFDDLDGTHVASCRVAVDAAGQLHRVFQAAGGSPDQAYAALFATVRAWKERVAGGATLPRQ